MATDQQIREAVMKLFGKYDTNNTGYVEGQELYNLCNDLAQELAYKRKLTNQ